MQSIHLALAAAPPAGQQAPFVNTLIMFAIIGLIFYFLLILPQQKQAKQRRAMLSALKKGDNVVVAGGIHGRIVSVGERLLVVEIADKVKIKVNRDAVVGLLEPDTGTDTGKKIG